VRSYELRPKHRDSFSYSVIGKGQIRHLITRGIRAVRYASFYNLKNSRVSYVFLDRFKSEPMQDEQNFLATVGYIPQQSSESWYGQERILQITANRLIVPWGGSIR
jgi:hypothetical protein